MEIHVRSQQGNTLVALGIATQLLRKVDRKADADKLTKDVFAAGSYREALDLITTATNGSITFVGLDELDGDE